MLGNTVVDGMVAKLNIFGACRASESRKSLEVQITLTSAMTSYKICVSVFDEADTDYVTYNPLFYLLFWRF